jgi:nitroimidazol reductase NimA-like FMN-containing flavoprotein (pyridoxamine 5'-phosphate oxidase superfamily)
MPAAGAAELTARAVIDASLYLVLATADGTGRPWSSPVYFAHDGYAEFLWVSAPEAEHSRNIAARPQVGIVIFDSHAPIGTGQGVYISATAEQAGSDDLTRGIETFSRRSLAHGGAGWTVKNVQAESGLRLYRAVADSYSILAKDGQPDHRIPAHLA